MSFDKLFDGSNAHLLPEIELKQLIEDAAKLLGYKHVADNIYDAGDFVRVFDPCDPERGDLRKVMEAAELAIDCQFCQVTGALIEDGGDFRLCALEEFTKGDYQSLAYAVLRAASAVWKARGGE